MARIQKMKTRFRVTERSLEIKSAVQWHRKRSGEADTSLASNRVQCRLFVATPQRDKKDYVYKQTHDKSYLRHKCQPYCNTIDY